MLDQGNNINPGQFAGLGQVENIYETTANFFYDSRDYLATDNAQDLYLLKRAIPSNRKNISQDTYYHYRNVYYPNKGWLYNIRAGIGTNFDEFKYFRYALEIQRFLKFRLFSSSYSTRVLAIRGKLNHVKKLTGSSLIPYYKLEILDRNFGLRGYHKGRFRGNGSILFSLEYRAPLPKLKYINGFLFFDEGQIFDNYSELSLPEFKYSYGFGLNLMTELGFFGKLQLAWSDEEHPLTKLSLKHTF